MIAAADQSALIIEVMPLEGSAWFLLPVFKFTISIPTSISHRKDRAERPPNVQLVMDVNLHDVVIVQSRNESLGGTMNSEKDSITLACPVPNMATASLREVIQAD